MPTIETGSHAHGRGSVGMLGTKEAFQGTPSSHTDVHLYRHEGTNIYIYIGTGTNEGLTR